MILFPDLPDVLIEHIDIADEITLTLRATSPTALCPTCQTSSTRVQSRYSRTLHDLPSAGRPVHLIVHLRRFFCKKNTCGQKIFTERLPGLCRPYAQRTLRLQEALCQLGLRVGGQAERTARYEHIRALQKQGVKSAEIALLRAWTLGDYV